MLKDPPFRNLWFSQTVSLFGTHSSLVIIPLIALNATHAKPFHMGLLESMESLSVLVLGLHIGARVDRHPRRATMIWANMLRLIVISMVPIAYLLGHLSISLLLAVTFVIGALSLMYDSALSGYIMQIVPRSRLSQANSYLQGSTAVSEVGGPAIGGVLAKVLGPPLGLIADAVSYLVSTVVLLFSRDGGQDRQNDRSGRDLVEDPEQEPENTGLLAGFAYVYSHPVLRPITIAAAHFNFFTAMFFGVYTLHIVRDLGFSPLLVGLASAAGGLGGIISAAVASRFIQSIRTWLIYTGSLAIPACAAFLVPTAGKMPESLGLRFAFVAVAQFLWAFGVVVNLVASDTIKQMVTPVHLIGRVTSTERFAALGPEPAGAVIGGTIAQFSSPVAALVIASSGLITSVFWLLVSGPLRRYEIRKDMAVSESSPLGRDEDAKTVHVDD